MAGMKNKDPNDKTTQSWETFQGTYTYMSVCLIFIVFNMNYA